MPKFNFRLQPLLNMKHQMEDSLKNDLGKAIQRLELEKNQLIQINAHREECFNRINRQSSQGITVEKLREYNAYIALLKEKVNIQKENVNCSQENVDKCREILLKIVQEREMLEKLRENKYQEFLVEQLKAEQKLNDEIISFNYNNALYGIR